MRYQALFLIVLQLVFERSRSLNIRVVAGSSLALPCLPDRREFDQLAFVWKYNGEPIIGSQGVTEPSSSFNLLQNGMLLSVSPVTPATAGVYECEAQENNIAWMNTHTIEVETPTGYILKIQEGSDINLPCLRPAGSQSEAFALWYIEDGGQKSRLNPVEVSNDSDRIEWLFVDPSGNDQSITIKDPVIKDSGTYLCESANGERFATIKLIVEAAPTIAPHSCSGFTTAWEPCQDASSRSWAPMLAESLADFSVRLYSQLRQLHPSKNLLYSPLSISGALYHLLLGARGVTRSKMEAALRLPHEFHCLHLQMKQLKETLKDSLRMASQIYYNPEMNLTQSFIDQSVEFYEAQPARLRVSDKENTEMINSWVAEKTDNKITQLVNSVPTDTQLILLNAVSFSGQWKNPFEKQRMTAPFTKLNGDIISVPFLYAAKYVAPTNYVSELKAQVVELSLSGDNSLYILLPHSHTLSSLEMVESRVSEATLRRMVDGMKEARPEVIELQLPKIKLDVQASITALLRKLDLSVLFESPNLCGLYAEEPVLVSDAQHRAFLALTEEGVEAGAATALVFARSYPTFSAMRPFVLLLWNNLANVPLFMGRVTEP